MSNRSFVAAIAVVIVWVGACGCDSTSTTTSQQPKIPARPEAPSDLMTESLVQLQVLHQKDGVITEKDYQTLRARAIEHLAEHFRGGRVSEGQKEYLYRSCVALAEELRELKRIRDSGAITEAEFEKLKAAAIESWRLTVTIE